MIVESKKLRVLAGEWSSASVYLPLPFSHNSKLFFIRNAPLIDIIFQEAHFLRFDTPVSHPHVISQETEENTN